jgi:hypothetical protein
MKGGGRENEEPATEQRTLLHRRAVRQLDVQCVRVSRSESRWFCTRRLQFVVGIKSSQKST